MQFIKLSIVLLVLCLFGSACSKSKKNYMDCGQENESVYYGKWKIKIQIRDSAGGAASAIVDSASAVLGDDDDHLTTVNPISLSSMGALYSYQFLNDGNNAQDWYWAPDLACKAHQRFNIYTTGFRDLLLTFNVTEFSANRIVMNVVVPVNTNKEMTGSSQYAEEWIWTR
jgi:hypothetical protein